MSSMSRWNLLVLLTLAALPAPAGAATHVVRELPGRLFSPTNVTIAVGDTITWRNDDTMAHTATSGTFGAPDGRFDSGDMPAGATFSYTFTAAGTYPYYCDYHGNMSGSVTVIEAVTVLELTGRVFSPASVTIDVGQTVLWVNADTMAHTATSGTFGSPDGRFDSGDMPPGATFSHTFTAAGTFPYYCDYHGNMTGEVIVRPAASNPAVLTASRSGNDVVLRWTGGSAPFTLLRGQVRSLTDLSPLPGPVTSPYFDLAAVAPPPSLYVYQLQ